MGMVLYDHNKQEDILYSIYNPKSVVEAMLRHRFGNYWNQTETYEALKDIHSDEYGWIKRCNH